MEEIKIYKTKTKPLSAIVVFCIILYCCVLLIIESINLKHEAYYIPLLFGLSGLGYSIYFLTKKIKQLFENKVHLMISSSGIETSTTPFIPWSSIRNIKVITLGSGNHLLHFLEYNYNGGKENFKLNDLTKSPEKIEKLINTYYDKSDYIKSNTIKNDHNNKEELIKKFFDN